MRPYFTALPNPGAGIGHQIANWIAGYSWAKDFNLMFAHLPFSPNGWEDFLGLGIGEMDVNELLKKGYKVRRIPLFDEHRPQDINLVQNIIASYSGTKTIILCEQDQPYLRQFSFMDDFKKKFYSADARNHQKLIFSPSSYNIAIHVRRGDVSFADAQRNGDSSLRWQSDTYFIKVLQSVLNLVKTNKEIKIYLFSQGQPDEFKSFNAFPNLTFCMAMGPQESFLHMVYADVLITSKSSFSYKPALLNNGLKICPRDFWHDYPKSSDWVLCESDGTFSINLETKI